jgi:hypothetical protein
MTPQEAAEGTVELVLPEGGRVLVEFPEAFAGNPDVEGDLVQIMLSTEGSDGEVCEAICLYAEAVGLTARYALRRESMVVEIVDTAGRTT